MAKEGTTGPPVQGLGQQGAPPDSRVNCMVEGAIIANESHQEERSSQFSVATESYTGGLVPG